MLFLCVLKVVEWMLKKKVADKRHDLKILNVLLYHLLQFDGFYLFIYLFRLNRHLHFNSLSVNVLGFVQ